MYIMLLFAVKYNFIILWLFMLCLITKLNSLIPPLYLHSCIYSNTFQIFNKL